jgi:hypothetical protein
MSRKVTSSFDNRVNGRWESTQCHRRHPESIIAVSPQLRKCSAGRPAPENHNRPHACQPDRRMVVRTRPLNTFPLWS